VNGDIPADLGAILMRITADPNNLDMKGVRLLV
jgi:hypothetical protein